MQLDGQLRHLLDVVEAGGAPVTSGARDRLGDTERQYVRLRQALSLPYVDLPLRRAMK